jgi:predicted HicB family RNase H-like nuclease
MIMEVGKMAALGRLNVYIEPQLHTDVKVFAAQTNQSISAVVEIALREYLAKKSQTDPK